MILIIYIVCVLLQVIIDLTVDLGTRGTKFNRKWLIEFIGSALLSPITPIYNLVMAIWLRDKGIYIFVEDNTDG